jgi:hypothetical protein
MWLVEAVGAAAAAGLIATGIHEYLVYRREHPKTTVTRPAPDAGRATVHHHRRTR